MGALRFLPSGTCCSVCLRASERDRSTRVSSSGRVSGLDARRGTPPGRPSGSPRRLDDRTSEPCSTLWWHVHLLKYMEVMSEKSLAAVPTNGATRANAWPSKGEPAIEATLARVSRGLQRPGFRAR